MVRISHIFKERGEINRRQAMDRAIASQGYTWRVVERGDASAINGRERLVIAFKEGAYFVFQSASIHRSSAVNAA
jgi:hypothetical protein